MLWLLYDGKVDIKTKWIKCMLYVKKEKDLKNPFPGYHLVFLLQENLVLRFFHYFAVPQNSFWISRGLNMFIPTPFPRFPGPRVPHSIFWGITKGFLELQGGIKKLWGLENMVWKCQICTCQGKCMRVKNITKLTHLVRILSSHKNHLTDLL